MIKQLNIPPVWTALAALMSIALGHLYILTFKLPVVLGWGVILCASVLFIWSISWFKRKKTTIIPRQAPSALITEGPFKISRNPIYLSMCLLVSGIGLIMGNLIALLPALWLWWFLDKNYARPEEDKLRAEMGDAAVAYFAQTGRWIWFYRRL